GMASAYNIYCREGAKKDGRVACFCPPSWFNPTMSVRELVVLSPYRLPTQSPLVLAPEEMAAWCNAYSALWHPAALWQAAGPPRADSPYDHEQPRPGHVYALPEAPPLMLPDNWDERVRQAGAVSFVATTDRPATLRNLLNALRAHAAAAPETPPGQQEAHAKLLALGPEQTAPFFAIGFGCVMEAPLCEAMEHENLLDTAAFWQEVQQAVALLAGVPYVPPRPPAPRDEYGGNPDTGGYAPPPTDGSYDLP